MTHVQITIQDTIIEVRGQDFCWKFPNVGKNTKALWPILRGFCDRETGKPRGFAFVDFDDRSQAEEAIRRFNQYMFKDRAIAVNEARAQESSPTAGPGARPQSRPRAGSAPPSGCSSPRPSPCP